jgi:hypothetical protein
MELHACLGLGVLASCIPSPTTTSPRNSYQSATWASRRSACTRRFLRRMDTGVHVMTTDSASLVSQDVGPDGLQ